MKLWAGRFQKETDTLVNDFNSSIGFDARLYQQDIAGSIAHAEMLGLMVNEPRIDPEALQKLRVRTLVIVGTKDMIKDEHTLLIARSLPRSRLEIIAGDHFIAAKNPGAFNRAVDEFLSEP